MGPKMAFFEGKSLQGSSEVVSPPLYNQGLQQSRNLLQGLARALYSSERLSVLKLALMAFDHHVASMHDRLAKAGALNVLCRCLQNILTSATTHWTEVHQTCELISMAFRCSDEVAINCIEEIGTDLVVCLFAILMRNETAREEASVVRLLLHRIAKLEVSFNAVEDSTRLLLLLEQMALLNNINAAMSDDAVAILAGWTSHPESRAFVLESRTFLNSLIKCSQEKAVDADAKQHIARIFQNLTSHGFNKSRMTERSTLEQLVDLTSSHHYDSTRIQAIQALRHLSIEPSSKLFIVTFDAGRIVTALMDCSKDDSFRLNVLETLLSLTCRHTASALANYSKLVDMLVRAASSEDSQQAEKAAQTIKRLATYVGVGDKGHSPVYNAILELSASQRWRIRRWMAKALQGQSKLSGCSFLMVRSLDALKRISDLARDVCIEIRDPAVDTINALSASPANLKRLSAHRPILDALAETIRQGIEDLDRTFAVRSAILAVLAMLDNGHAKRKLAKHIGIVRSLSRYSVSNDSDDELKEAALHGVILLSPWTNGNAQRRM